MVRNKEGLQGGPLVIVLKVWIVSEDLVDPLGVVGHVDEDGGPVSPGTASAVNADTQDDLTPAFLTYQRSAVVSLQDKNTHYGPGERLSRQQCGLIYSFGCSSCPDSFCVQGCCVLLVFMRLYLLDYKAGVLKVCTVVWTRAEL